jgi:coenzyme F420-reducing hydrogenase delta subunit
VDEDNTVNINEAQQLKLFVFYCSNNFSINEFNRLLPANDGIEYKCIGLPCSGKADLLYFVKAFEKGADGLILITCPKDECRYLEGNLRSPRRAEGLNNLLDEIGMGRERVTVLTSKKDDVGLIVSAVVEFRNKLMEMRVSGAAR